MNATPYFLVLTKPVPAQVPDKASFSISDTIVTLYKHRSTNLLCNTSLFWQPASVANTTQFVTLILKPGLTENKCAFAPGRLRTYFLGPLCPLFQGLFVC